MNLEKLFEEYPLIESESVILGKIEETHLSELFSIYDNENVFKYCGILPKHNIDTVRKMISHFERDFNKKSRVKLGIHLNNSSSSLVGIIEIMDIKKKIDMVSVGYYLSEENWGKGIATQAVSLLLDYLFNTVEVNRVHAEVMIKNEASKKVLLNNGFIKEGLIRQGSFWPGKGIVDLELYGILRSDFELLSQSNKI